MIPLLSVHMDRMKVSEAFIVIMIVLQSEYFYYYHALLRN